MHVLRHHHSVRPRASCQCCPTWDEHALAHGGRQIALQHKLRPWSQTPDNVGLAHVLTANARRKLDDDRVPIRRIIHQHPRHWNLVPSPIQPLARCIARIPDRLRNQLVGPLEPAKMNRILQLNHVPGVVHPTGDQINSKTWSFTSSEPALPLKSSRCSSARDPSCDPQVPVVRVIIVALTTLVLEDASQLPSRICLIYAEWGIACKVAPRATPMRRVHIGVAGWIVARTLLRRIHCPRAVRSDPTTRTVPAIPVSRIPAALVHGIRIRGVKDTIAPTVILDAVVFCEKLW
mmetsp:Transcript_34298/g.91650  ORF Transcript_34298/g.91650 Transcript_34298/m.91650 type:complete len:291 (-) Transcript_34298:434-1306(-)